VGFLLWHCRTTVKNRDDFHITDLSGSFSEKESFQGERVRGLETSDEIKAYGRDFKIFLYRAACIIEVHRVSFC